MAMPTTKMIFVLRADGTTDDADLHRYPHSVHLERTDDYPTKFKNQMGVELDAGWSGGNSPDSVNDLESSRTWPMEGARLSSGSDQCNFRIDLPNGKYRLQACWSNFGTTSLNHTIEIYDGATLIQTIADGTTDINYNAGLLADSSGTTATAYYSTDYETWIEVEVTNGYLEVQADRGAFNWLGIEADPGVGRAIYNPDDTKNSNLRYSRTGFDIANTQVEQAVLLDDDNYTPTTVSLDGQQGVFLKDHADRATGDDRPIAARPCFEGDGTSQFAWTPAANVPVDITTIGTVGARYQGASAPATADTILSAYNWQNNKRCWALSVNTSGFALVSVFETGNSTPIASVTGTVSICDGIPHSLGFSWDSGELVLYVDGKEAGRATAGFSSVYASYDYLRLGSSGTGTYPNYTNVLENKAWDVFFDPSKAFSSVDWREWHLRTDNAPSVKHHWKVGEEDGDRLYDSGAANDADLTQLHIQNYTASVWSTCDDAHNPNDEEGYLEADGSTHYRESSLTNLIDAGVKVPKQDGNSGSVAFVAGPAKAALGVSGPAPRPAKIVSSPCWLGDGTSECFTASSQFATQPTTDLVVLCWIKQTAHPVSDEILMSQYDWVSDNRGWLLKMTDYGKISVVLSSAGTAVDKDYETNDTFDDGEWHEVGFRWTASTLDIFVDGISVAVTKTTDTAMSSINQTPAYLVIGNNWNGSPTLNSLEWSGELAMARVFVGSLTDQEIFDGYNDWTANTPDYCWPLEEGGGDTIYDVVGNIDLTQQATPTTWSTQSVTAYNFKNGFRLDTGVYIPAKADLSAAADDNAITNPAGAYHNNGPYDIDFDPFIAAWAKGVYEGYLSCPGTSGHYLTIPGWDWSTGDSLRLTCQVWIDDLDGNDQVIFQQEDGSGTGRSHLFVNATGDEWATYINGSDTLGSTAPTGRWIDVDLSCDSVSGLVAVIDGITEFTVNSSLEVTNGDFRLFSTPTDTSHLDGRARDIKVYRAGTLIHHFPFHGNLLDYTENADHPTVTGFNVADDMPKITVPTAHSYGDTVNPPHWGEEADT